VALTTTTVAPRPRIRRFSGLSDVLRSEFCKLRSVRSTYWTLVAALAFNIGFAALEAIFLPGRLSAHDKATLDGVRVSLGGSHLSQIAFGVLGVLIITSEYTTGMIRVTFSAVPRRRVVLAAKAITFACTALIVGIVASFAAYFVFQWFLTGDSLRSSVGDPGVLRALIGGGLYLVVLGLLGFGLGIVLRSSAGAIAALFALLFVPQILVELLPSTWKTTIGPYVPMEAGSQIFSQHHEAGALGPWTGFGVFCLYAAVALVAGFVLINRRDS
jgi:ABC-type transport system involved in multi-copper enzyme maturation permease subunit